MLTVLLHIWLVVLIWVVLKSLVTVRSKNARQDMKKGGTWEGKRSGGTGKGEKEEVNGESIHLYGQHVTEFLTVLANAWYCMTMRTYIVLILNLPAEYEGIDQFMLGRR